MGEESRPGYLGIQAVESVDGAEAARVTHESVMPGAVIRTDGLNVYGILNSEGYEQHGEKFDPQGNPEHLHWLHVVISNLKAFISGTYHGLGKKHLQRYFDEFCYRFNRRRFGNQLFNRLLDACASTTTITYAQLVKTKLTEATL